MGARLSGAALVHSTAAACVIVGIDLSKRDIVLWVPGTSQHGVPDKLKDMVAKLMPDSTIVVVEYAATTRFASSRAEGMRNLVSILSVIKKRMRKGQRLFVAGESQGAWVVSDILANHKYYEMISGAVLLGHPGIAANHFKDDPKVLEINHTDDIVTMADQGDMELAHNVERFLHGDLLTAPYFVKYAISHPHIAAWLALLGISRIPYIGNLVPMFHDYSNDYLLATLWLADDRG